MTGESDRVGRDRERGDHCDLGGDHGDLEGVHCGAPNVSRISVRHRISAWRLSSCPRVPGGKLPMASRPERRLWTSSALMCCANLLQRRVLDLDELVTAFEPPQPEFEVRGHRRSPSGVVDDQPLMTRPVDYSDPPMLAAGDADDSESGALDLGQMVTEGVYWPISDGQP